MKKYRKKPVVIEAEQWHTVLYVDKGKIIGFEEWSKLSRKIDIAHPVYYLNVGYFRRPDIEGSIICKHCRDIMHNHGWIDTLEGGHIVCPNDWIIKGIKGEFYPIKNDIFLETYELAECK